MFRVTIKRSQSGPIHSHQRASPKELNWEFIDITGTQLHGQENYIKKIRPSVWGPLKNLSHQVLRRGLLKTVFRLYWNMYSEERCSLKTLIFLKHNCLALFNCVNMYIKKYRPNCYYYSTDVVFVVIIFIVIVIIFITIIIIIIYYCHYYYRYHFYHNYHYYHDYYLFYNYYHCYCYYYCCCYYY